MDDLQYFEVFQKVYYNTDNFNAETFPHLIAMAYDALTTRGEFIVDVNGTMLDIDYVDTVTQMFFTFVSEKDGIYIYRKDKSGIEALDIS